MWECELKFLTKKRKESSDTVKNKIDERIKVLKRNIKEEQKKSTN